MPVKDLVARLSSVKYLPYQPVPVAEDVTKDVVFYIEEHRTLFPGVSYQVGSVRSYPFGSLAAQILGWTGEVSDAQLQEPQFKGYRPGSRGPSRRGRGPVPAGVVRHGRGPGDPGQRPGAGPGPGLRRTAGGAGQLNVVLSMNTGIQQLAEESLATGIDVAHHTIDGVSGKPLRAPGGAVIVLDPKTGGLLAMASNPSYDPAIFNGGLSTGEARSLDLCGKCPAKHNQPLLNRATQGLYPAGSSFKPFVAAAALHEGYAKINGRYNCPRAGRRPSTSRTTSSTTGRPWTTATCRWPRPSPSPATRSSTSWATSWRTYWRSPSRTNELMQKDLRGDGLRPPHRHRPAGRAERHLSAQLGAEVANIGVEQWQATMEVLAVLEGYATALAAPHLSEGDVVLLGQHAAAMQHAMEQFDLLRFSDSNRAYHSVIYARCPNPVSSRWPFGDAGAARRDARDALSERAAARGGLDCRAPEADPGLLEEHAAFEDIKAYAREHKLHFLLAAVRQFEQWAMARQSRISGSSETNAA